MNWNLTLPDNIQTCNDILSELERAVDKLEDSNKYIRNVLNESYDAELENAIQENEVVIRRKKHQIDQIHNHLNNIKKH